MEAELKRLVRRAAPSCVDLKPKRDGDSSLIYPFHPELAWMAVRYLRTPSRALWSLYATTSRVSNSATAKYVIPGGSTVAVGQGSRGTEFGIYHTF